MVITAICTFTIATACFMQGIVIESKVDREVEVIARYTSHLKVKTEVANCETLRMELKEVLLLRNKCSIVSED